MARAGLALDYAPTSMMGAMRSGSVVSLMEIVEVAMASSVAALSPAPTTNHDTPSAPVSS